MLLTCRLSQRKLGSAGGDVQGSSSGVLGRVKNVFGGKRLLLLCRTGSDPCSISSSRKRSRPGLSRNRDRQQGPRTLPTRRMALEPLFAVFGLRLRAFSLCRRHSFPFDVAAFRESVSDRHLEGQRKSDCEALGAAHYIIPHGSTSHGAPGRSLPKVSTFHIAGCKVV